MLIEIMRATPRECNAAVDHQPRASEADGLQSIGFRLQRRHWIFGDSSDASRWIANAKSAIIHAAMHPLRKD
jgi:hypothetical protein